MINFVTELQNCLVLPTPHKCDSQTAPDFMIFIKNKTIITVLVGNGFQRCWADEQSKSNTKFSTKSRQRLKGQILQPNQSKDSVRILSHSQLKLKGSPIQHGIT